MKKKLLAALTLSVLVLFVFSACGKPDVNDASKNLSSYTITAEYNDETKTVAASQTVKYRNNSGSVLNTVEFHLYGNAYREGASFSPIRTTQEADAYPNGKSYGTMSVSALKSAGQEKEVNVEGQDSDILIVPLDKPLYPGSTVTIEMDFEVKLANVSHRLGYDGDSVNLGNWFPITSVHENGEFQSNPYYANGDPFYSDLANFDVTMTTGAGLIHASTGSLASENTAEEGKRISRFTAKAVRDFAMVLMNGENYKTLTANAGDAKITYFYAKDAEPEKSLETARLALNTYNDMIGEYPYSTLAVVETSFLQGGMEYPNIVFISHKVEPAKYQDVIAHEIAHQWWYGVVGTDPVKNAWMDEGLTEYTTTLFFERNPSYNSTRQDRVTTSLRNYVIYFDVYQSVKGETDTSMNRPINAYASEFEYTYLTYVKGELMFDTLRTLVHDKAFFKGLSEYYKDYAFKTATPANLIQSFEKAARTPLKGFFASWLEGDVTIEG